MAAAGATTALTIRGDGPVRPRATPSATERRRRPNFILVLADDLGYGELGSYGQRMMRTPRLDRLASEGVRFTHFYSGAAVCAPSRCTLLTGRHAGHSRVRDNPQGTDAPLAPQDVTFGMALRQAGYRTGLFGKWGFGGPDPNTDTHPNDKGFEEFYGYLSHKEAHSYFPSKLWDNRTPVRFAGNRRSGRAVYAPEVIVQRSLQFMERHRDEPFLLVLTLPLPHAPSVVPGDPYPRQPWRLPDRAHAAQVSLLDSYVGRLVDKLAELGLVDDTLLFFTSDNGPHEEGDFDPDFFGARGGLRGYKRSLYEGGIRVPLIAWGPGHLTRTRGTVSARPTAMWDLFPTLTDLAGLGPAEGDGISLRGILTGRGRTPQHEYLYWVRPSGSRRTPRVARAERGRTWRAGAAVRFGNWKLVGYAPGRHYSEPDDSWSLELYDLRADPAETTDIARAHPDVVSRGIGYLREAWEPPG
ncbi:arylsulfatase [Thermomonospora amylolytica]|uniref:arylsulfatase n=1 Tax=Thermomonospora amylolytica TaxID=1411117 RepID=UPI0013007378|nr:arylsulfatase [Thermomonospora amylolytica]